MERIHFINSPVPKLGPPLNARPDHKCPCMTPALTSSRNRYNGSWNLSFKRAGLIAWYIARARGEWVCVFSRNLQTVRTDYDTFDQKHRHPRNSRNLQMTFATTSSFLSSGPWDKALFILVRFASFSDAVAPKHSAKSIVEDCIQSISQRLST